MQTTLLGLAVALILALVAALVGPFFIDWNQFRPQFEAEASRVMGAPVRVTGQIDARLLPSPSLRLRGVRIGRPADTSGLEAERLEVEFSLGALMRGEWVASELALTGLSTRLALGPEGRFIAPLGSGSFDLSRLSIDRLTIEGKVILADAMAGTTTVLDDFSFSGDVRLASSAMRGAGAFRKDGLRYPYRLSSSRSGDGNGVRLRLGIDAVEQPYSADLDGVLSLENLTPRLSGTLAVARAPALKGTDAAAGLQPPWRFSARIKADPATAQLEQLEASYGADEAALKLGGSAAVRFGRMPALQVNLGARQIDLDRLATKLTGNSDPLRMLPTLRRLISGPSAPSFDTRLRIDVDNATVGSQPVQGISAEINGAPDGWTLDRFDARLPGGTRVQLSGRMGAGDRFLGPLVLDTTDAEALTAWLGGRTGPVSATTTPLAVSCRITFGDDRLGCEGLKADIAGNSLSGDLTLTDRRNGGRRLDASLVATTFDVDALRLMADAVLGPQPDWPEEASLNLVADRALVAGRKLGSLRLVVRSAPELFTLQQLSARGDNGLTIEGAGTLDRAGATGRLNITASAASTPAITGLFAPLLPAALAGPMETLDRLGGAAKAGLAVTLDRGKGDRASLNATLDVVASSVTIRLKAQTPVAADTIRSSDVEAIRSGELTTEGRVAGPARDVANLLLLDRVLGKDNAQAVAEFSASGSWQRPSRIRVSLNGPGIDLAIDGTARRGSWSSIDQGTFDVSVKRLDPAPLLELPSGRLPAIAPGSAARLSLDDERIALTDIDARIGSSRVRGMLSWTRATEPEIGGELGMDTLDLGTVTGLLAGATGRGADEPLGRNPLFATRGSVRFQALRATLPGIAELRPVSGQLVAAGPSLALKEVRGQLGGGEARADLTFVQGSEGLAMDGKLSLSNVDAAALSSRGIDPLSGRVSAQAALASRGRTPGVLLSALTGSGTVTLDSAALRGVDPDAFTKAVAASDAASANSLVKEKDLKDIVTAALQKAPLRVANVEIPFTLRDGSLRFAATTFDGDTARIVASGGYDFLADQIDLRATLVAKQLGAEGNRPEIQLFLHGAPERLLRTVDVSLLASWLAVRVIDRETRRLDAIERGETPSPAPGRPAPGRSTPDQRSGPMPAPPAASAPATAPTAPQTASSPTREAAPPLPPPIDVKPAPAPPRARPSPPRPPVQLLPPSWN